jgi:hypothetical protein
MLKTKSIPPYTIKELSIGEYVPMFDLIGTDSRKGQLELMKKCIFLNGNAIGDKLTTDIGASMFLPLWNAVAEVNGLQHNAGDSGNDLAQ